MPVRAKDHPLHVTWTMMRQRCENPNAIGYELYGGRGIKVCERWQTFDNFIADVGDRPSGRTLDRIDTNKDYEPGNWRWATKAEQARNRRTTKLTPKMLRVARGLKKIGWTGKSIARVLGVNPWTLRQALRGVTWAKS